MKNKVFTDLNIQERTAMLKAMDTIVRNLNDEHIIFYWLEEGVPDATKDEDYVLYADDDCYPDIEVAFEVCMKMALSIQK